MDMAVELLAAHEGLRRMVNAMTSRVFSIQEGVQAIEHAQQKGVLKVQIAFGENKQ